MAFWNRWTGGNVKLKLPPLPQHLVGVTGAMFERATFSPEAGEEVYLLILEQPPYAAETGRLKSMGLYAKTAVVRTSAGPLALILWTLKDGKRHIVDYEHFLNPFETTSFRLLKAAGQQQELKVVLLDSSTGETEGFWGFPNTYQLGEFGAGLAQAVGGEPDADFAATQAAFMREFTIEELRAL